MRNRMTIYSLTACLLAALFIAPGLGPVSPAIILIERFNERLL